MTKAEIRQWIRTEKKKLTLKEREVCGEQVKNLMKTFSLYQEAEDIYLFASYNQELPTYGIIKQALSEGKKVALPKVEGKDIVFYYIEDIKQLAPGYQGIPEPKPSLDTLALPPVEKPALMLMPGLAFTKSGERLGYGGGFYDRYLFKSPDKAFITCGLGYDFQVFQSLPMEEHDFYIEYLMTPSMVVACNRI